MKVMRVGLDIAKHVFEVYGIDAQEHMVLSRRLSRSQMGPFFAQLEPCLVAMESCGSAHHWARTLRRLGHEVRLIAPQFVTPYRRGGKNDANDARAICEAAGRPDMHFVPVKSLDQQATLVVHRARTLLVAERTALVNHVRGLLAEFGIIVAQGVRALRRALPEALEDGENELPDVARTVFAELYERLCDLDTRVADYDQRIARLAKDDERVRRLMTVPGIGPLTATALVACVGDATEFASGRQFAAWLGLTPKQFSSGGKTRLGRITKRGDRYLRTLFVHGARNGVAWAARREDPRSRWTQALRERRGFNKATVALAAKTARIAWAILTTGRSFDDHRLAPQGA